MYKGKFPYSKPPNVPGVPDHLVALLDINAQLQQHTNSNKT
jgi:hypothetical protein